MKILAVLMLALVILTLALYMGITSTSTLPQAHNFHNVSMGDNYPSQVHRQLVNTVHFPSQAQFHFRALHPTATVRVQEDAAEWECSTVGNKLCAEDVIRYYPIRY